MSSKHEISRRQFFISTAAVGGALVLGFYLPSRTAQAANVAPKPWTPPVEGGQEVNAWLLIGSDDTVTIRVAQSEMGQGVLPPFRENLRAYAKKELEGRRVEVRLGEAVAEVGPTSVKLKSGEEIKTHTLVWAAGVQANPLARMLGMPQGRGGRVKLNPDLSVPEHPEIFVVGDMGEVTSEEQVLPQLASVAMQSGEHVGRQIARRITGEETQAFKYWNKGVMATIGRGSAVVEFPNKRTLHGPLAYFAWLGVHLVLLSGMRNRIETLWNWGWSALTHDRAARIIIEGEEETRNIA